jgi:hypothetical protein
MYSSGFKGPFGLAYFLAYAEQLTQIIKLLCIIQNLAKVVYEKTAYEDTIIVSEN